MNTTDVAEDWSGWLSTYGVLTADRILERFNIKLSHDDLISALKDSHTLYFQLLRVPMRHVFNGIILQQAYDYQVYAQKMFVDYLLSGEDGKDSSAPGASIREDLERERLRLVELSNAFLDLENQHLSLIAGSQKRLIELTQDITMLLNYFNDNAEYIREKLADFIEQSETLNIDLRSHRSQFYDLILRVKELIVLLPDYRPDIEKNLENLENLQFDSLIGE
jgi:hypothetical protein